MVVFFPVFCFGETFRIISCIILVKVNVASVHQTVPNCEHRDLPTVTDFISHVIVSVLCHLLLYHCQYVVTDLSRHAASDIA